MHTIDDIFVNEIMINDFSRTNAVTTDLSDHVEEDIESEIKKMSEISMGTEISEEDIMNIQHLCTQIITISDYRGVQFVFHRLLLSSDLPLH